MSESISIIGTAAGRVWSYLYENGTASATKMTEVLELDKNEIQRAIGWLAREGKLSVEKKGKNELFRLNAES
ncbi:MAG: winged helix-turn-helix domain-containing protein [Methylococcaceae bacterium]